MRRTSAGDGASTPGVNYSHARNEVIYTGEMPYPGDGDGYKGYAYSHRVEGYPLGQQFGYLVDRSNGSGYISTDEELAKYTKMYSGIGIPRKGDLIYNDVTATARQREGPVAHRQGQPPDRFHDHPCGLQLERAGTGSDVPGSDPVITGWSATRRSAMPTVFSTTCTRRRGRPNAMLPVRRLNTRP